MEPMRPAAPAAQTTQGGGGGGVFLLVGLGLFALMAAGGGYYLWSESKRKKEEAQLKADEEASKAAALDAQKVPLMKDGKPILDKGGKPVMVEPSTVKAGLPIIGDDGKAVTDKDGVPIIPTQSDVKNIAAIAENPDAAAPPEKPVSNDYVSGDTIEKRRSMTDAKQYSASAPDQNAFFKAIRELFDIVPRVKGKSEKDIPKRWKMIPKKMRENAEKDAVKKAQDTEKYVRGFMKGMNLALRSDYVGIYGQALTDWMNNPAKLTEAQVDKVALFTGDFPKAVEFNAGKINLRPAATTTAPPK